MLPVAIDRVLHSGNKFDFSMIQAESILDKVTEGDTTIIVGEIQHIHAINSYTILVSVIMLQL